VTPNTYAIGAGAATSEQAKKDEATGLAGIGGFEVQGNATDEPIVAGERLRVTANDNAIANLRRRAAAKGITLHILPGELLFCWAGLTKGLIGVEAASAWLDHVGAPR